MSWLSLEGASVTERLFMVAGASIGLLGYMSIRALFGGLVRQLPSRWPPAKPKAKPRKKGRR